MDSAGYLTVARQSGLLKEMQIIANNVANMSTTGFKAETLVFSEHIAASGHENPSLSLAHAGARRIVTDQGSIAPTNGVFDLAIEGEGYFLVKGVDREEVTRAGHFTTDGAGRLVTSDGRPVVDLGGAPILIPQEDGALSVAADGTISQNGRPLGQIAVVVPNDPLSLERVGNTRLASDKGWAPVENPAVMQGFLEASNVNAMEQVSRMIEVQRAYEVAQSLSDKENERITHVIKTLSR